MNKALAESAKKTAAKGKKKVGELSEVVQIEEMELVLQDEDEAESEGSIVSKRTRSARKSKKVQVVNFNSN